MTSRETKAMTASRANIPVFILAGGLGTRLAEETSLKPKPMVEVGDVPILLHIMRWYYSFGFNDFVICGGYRSWEIKNFFLSYRYRMNHLQMDYRQDQEGVLSALGKNTGEEKWRVRVIDTGQETMTGGRIARAYDIVTQTDQFTNFAVTYGDGLTDLNLDKELDFHLSHSKLGTVLGVPALARFGELDVDSNGQVSGFLEKPEEKQGLINGGFFFFKTDFRRYLQTDPNCILERNPLFQLAKDGQLMTFPHRGFWRPMDTLGDKIILQKLWDSGKAPWAPNTQKTALTKG